MLTRLSTLMICTLLTVSCSDSSIGIPNRNSMGLSQPLIEIYSPDANSALPANTPFTLDYAILRSSDGHHVKIRIDKRKPEIVIRRKGKHQMPGLPAGKHRIRITEYTKDGVKTGGDITLSVTMVESTEIEPETQNNPLEE